MRVFSEAPSIAAENHLSGAWASPTLAAVSAVVVVSAVAAMSAVVVVSAVAAMSAVRVSERVGP